MEGVDHHFLSLLFSLLLSSPLTHDAEDDEGEEDED